MKVPTGHPISAAREKGNDHKAYTKMYHDEQDSKFAGTALSHAVSSCANVSGVPLPACTGRVLLVNQLR